MSLCGPHAALNIVSVLRCRIASHDAHPAAKELVLRQPKRLAAQIVERDVDPRHGPAVAKARDAGLDIEGPYPADTLMIRARDGEFDAVVAMYHDQGHIALKLLGMHRAVNVTLGLPIIRTSVAHGTAFDLAWQRKANPASMIEALRVATLLAKQRS